MNLIAIWRRRQPDEVLLVASNLLSRGLGFCTSMLISRLVGVSALGVYSSVLITTSAATTPMTVPLANHGTLMLSNNQLSAVDVMRAQWPWWALSLFAGLTACHSMLLASQSQKIASESLASMWVLVSLMVTGHLLGQWLTGVMHGLGKSRRMALLSSSITLTGLSLTYPVIAFWGLTGAISLATCTTLGPGVCLAWFLLRKNQPSTLHAEQTKALRSDAWMRMRQSLPNMGSSLLNTGTNWLCSIYLVQRFHGLEGLGMVALSLQWTMLMQLAFSSWGGKIVHELSKHASRDKLEHPEALHKAMNEQIRRCLLVTSLSCCAVLAATPAIAWLYHVDALTMAGLLVLNALASMFAAVNFVYERVFFLMRSQRVWLLFAGLAYAAQIATTCTLVPVWLTGAAAGNVIACMVTSLGVSWHLRRTLFKGVAP